MRAPNRAGDGRAVNVNVKHIQENADPLESFASLLKFRHVGDLAVRGRNHGARVGRNKSMWVAKEPQEEGGEKDRNDGPNGTRQPRNQRSRAEQHQSIVVAISNHEEIHRLYCTAVGTRLKGQHASGFWIYLSCAADGSG